MKLNLKLNTGRQLSLVGRPSALGAKYVFLYFSACRTHRIFGRTHMYSMLQGERTSLF